MSTPKTEVDKALLKVFGYNETIPSVQRMNSDDRFKLIMFEGCLRKRHIRLKNKRGDPHYTSLYISSPPRKREDQDPPLTRQERLLQRRNKMRKSMITPRNSLSTLLFACTGDTQSNSG